MQRDGRSPHFQHMMQRDVRGRRGRHQLDVAAKAGKVRDLLARVVNREPGLNNSTPVIFRPTIRLHSPFRV
jgi:hypothetical protein